MKRIQIQRAANAQPLMIEIGDVPREPWDDGIAADKFHWQQDAQRLADALWDALPGGVADELTVALVQRALRRGK